MINSTMSHSQFIQQLHNEHELTSHLTSTLTRKSQEYKDKKKKYCLSGPYVYKGDM